MALDGAGRLTTDDARLVTAGLGRPAAGLCGGGSKRPELAATSPRVRVTIS